MVDEIGDQIVPIVEKPMSGRGLPALAPATIKRRKYKRGSNSTQPLYETGAWQRSHGVYDTEYGLRVDVNCFLLLLMSQDKNYRFWRAYKRGQLKAVSDVVDKCVKRFAERAASLG
jgi:hypothetical protein